MPFFGRIIIQIYLLHQNLLNICINEYIRLEIYEYLKEFEYLLCKNPINSTNECLNTFIAQKYNEYFYKRI